MRDLIKKILREEIQTDVDIDIMKYKGNDSEINRLKGLIYFGKMISDKDIEYAKNFFEKEKEQVDTKDDVFEPQADELPEPEEKELPRDEYLKKFKEELKTHYEKIKSEGVETYLELTRGTKRKLFRNEKIKVDKPSDAWFERNIKDLNIFRDKLKPLPTKKFKFGKTYQTINGQINLLLERLEGKDFYGFLEKVSDEYVWSILNKTDTNYSNWVDLIYDAEVEEKLGPQKKSTESKIESYFRQNPIRLDALGEKAREQLTNFVRENKVTSLSLADLDLIEAFNYKTPKSFEKSDKIFSNIIRTTEAGDNAEKMFMKFLLEDREVPESHIISFSSHGNLVDITFQTDLIVFNVEKNRWEPIQVKSKKQSSGLLRFGFPGAKIVYPSGNKWYQDKGPKSYEN
jgi:hypothetical protein